MRRSKFLLRIISDLEEKCKQKDATIAHLIKENELLSTQILIAQTSKLTATDLQRFKNLCNIDFPATTKVEKPENKIF